MFLQMKVDIIWEKLYDNIKREDLQNEKDIYWFNLFYGGFRI